MESKEAHSGEKEVDRARSARKIWDLVLKNDQKPIKNFRNQVPEYLHFTSLHFKVRAGKLPTSLYFTSKSFYQKLQALHFTSKSFFQNHRFFPLHFQLHFRTPPPALLFGGVTVNSKRSFMVPISSLLLENRIRMTDFGDWRTLKPYDPLRSRRRQRTCKDHSCYKTCIEGSRGLPSHLPFFESHRSCTSESTRDPSMCPRKILCVLIVLQLPLESE